MIGGVGEFEGEDDEVDQGYPVLCAKLYRDDAVNVEHDESQHGVLPAVPLPVVPAGDDPPALGRCDTVGECGSNRRTGFIAVSKTTLPRRTRQGRWCRGPPVRSRALC